jgi:integrase
MARRATGSLYQTRSGYGIRWTENGERPHQDGFRTKTEARSWFDDNVRPRLETAGPSPDITLEAFCNLWLARHGGSDRTVETLRERLGGGERRDDALPGALDRFGDFTLRELEGAAADIAGWRTSLPESARYRLHASLRQALEAAVRWGYLKTNPAVQAGHNPQPRRPEIDPFTRDEVDALAVELGNVYGPLAIFAAETGLRTNEWVGAHRKDIDRAGPAIGVQRRVADGKMTPYPKTARSRRRVPLSARALEAADSLPPRIDTPVLFPAVQGGYIGLDTWRSREWYPALEAAGIRQRGPYHLRHTFATEALAAGVSIFQLSRLMGASVKTIEDHYGHLARDSEDTIRALLDVRADRKGDEKATGRGGDRPAGGPKSAG